MRALSLSRKKFLRHERLAKHEKRSYLENQEGRQVLLTLTAPADSESLSKPSFRLMYQPESCPGSVPALPGAAFLVLRGEEPVNQTLECVDCHDFEHVPESPHEHTSFPGLPELSRKEGCPCGRLFVTEWGPKGKGVTLDFKGAFGILKIPTIRGVAVACCQSQAGRKSGFFLATNVSFIRMRLCIGRVTSGCPRGPGLLV